MWSHKTSPKNCFLSNIFGTLHPTIFLIFFAKVEVSSLMLLFFVHSAVKFSKILIFSCFHSHTPFWGQTFMDIIHLLYRGGGTWWQDMAAAKPIFEICITICNTLPYQYLRDYLGPSIPIFLAFRHHCFMNCELTSFMIGDLCPKNITFPKAEHDHQCPCFVVAVFCLLFLPRTLIGSR